MKEYILALALILGAFLIAGWVDSAHAQTSVYDLGNGNFRVQTPTKPFNCYSTVAGTIICY